MNMLSPPFSHDQYFDSKRLHIPARPFKTQLDGGGGGDGDNSNNNNNNSSSSSCSNNDDDDNNNNNNISTSTSSSSGGSSNTTSAGGCSSAGQQQPELERPQQLHQVPRGQGQLIHSRSNGNSSSSSSNSSSASHRQDQSAKTANPTATKIFERPCRPAHSPPRQPHYVAADDEAPSGGPQPEGAGQEEPLAGPSKAAGPFVGNSNNKMIKLNHHHHHHENQQQHHHQNQQQHQQQQQQQHQKHRHLNNNTNRRPRVKSRQFGRSSRRWCRSCSITSRGGNCCSSYNNLECDSNDGVIDGLVSYNNTGSFIRESISACDRHLHKLLDRYYNGPQFYQWSSDEGEEEDGEGECERCERCEECGECEECEECEEEEEDESEIAAQQPQLLAPNSNSNPSSTWPQAKSKFPPKHICPWLFGQCDLPPTAIPLVQHRYPEKVVLEGQQTFAFSQLSGEYALCLPHLLDNLTRRFNITRIIREFELNNTAFLETTPEQTAELIKLGLVAPATKSCALVRRSDIDRVCMRLFAQCYHGRRNNIIELYSKLVACDPEQSLITRQLFVKDDDEDEDQNETACITISAGPAPAKKEKKTKTKTKSKTNKKTMKKAKKKKTKKRRIGGGGNGTTITTTTAAISANSSHIVESSARVSGALDLEQQTAFAGLHDDELTKDVGVKKLFPESTTGSDSDRSASASDSIDKIAITNQLTLEPAQSATKELDFDFDFDQVDSPGSGRAPDSEPSDNDNDGDDAGAGASVEQLLFGSRPRASNASKSTASTMVLSASTTPSSMLARSSSGGNSTKKLAIRRRARKTAGAAYAAVSDSDDDKELDDNNDDCFGGDVFDDDDVRRRRLRRRLRLMRRQRCLRATIESSSSSGSSSPVEMERDDNGGGDIDIVSQLFGSSETQNKATMGRRKENADDTITTTTVTVTTSTSTTAPSTTIATTTRAATIATSNVVATRATSSGASTAKATVDASADADVDSDSDSDPDAVVITSCKEPTSGAAKTSGPSKQKSPDEEVTVAENPMLDLARALSSILQIRVYHHCFGRCKGLYYPSLLESSMLDCIECATCHIMLTPRRFIGHSHGNQEMNTVHWGFNSYNWPFYLRVSMKQPTNDLSHDELMAQVQKLVDSYRAGDDNGSTDKILLEDKYIFDPKETNLKVFFTDTGLSADKMDSKEVYNPIVAAAAAAQILANKQLRSYAAANFKFPTPREPNNNGLARADSRGTTISGRTTMGNSNSLVVCNREETEEASNKGTTTSQYQKAISSASALHISNILNSSKGVGTGAPAGVALTSQQPQLATELPLGRPLRICKDCQQSISRSSIATISGAATKLGSAEAVAAAAAAAASKVVASQVATLACSSNNGGASVAGGSGGSTVSFPPLSLPPPPPLPLPPPLPPPPLVPPAELRVKDPHQQAPADFDRSKLVSPVCKLQPNGQPGLAPLPQPPPPPMEFCDKEQKLQQPVQEQQARSNSPSLGPIRTEPIHFASLSPAAQRELMKLFLDQSQGSSSSSIIIPPPLRSSSSSLDQQHQSTNNWSHRRDSNIYIRSPSTTPTTPTQQQQLATIKTSDDMKLLATGDEVAKDQLKFNTELQREMYICTSLASYLASKGISSTLASDIIENTLIIIRKSYE